MRLKQIPKSFVMAALLLAGSAILPAQAEQFPEGLLGVKLGMARTAALEHLLAKGVRLDVEGTICTEQVADKYKSRADRICKMPTLEGSVYLGQPINKVSLMFKDDHVVLLGLDVGNSPEAFALMQLELGKKLGATIATNDGSARWREAPMDGVRASATKLVADDTRAYLVYSDEALQ